MDATSTWLIAIAVLVLYAHLAEYSIHRWIMHRPLGGWLRREYFEHAIEHHGRGRNDINISANPLVLFAVCSPLLVACPWLGWPWVAVVAAVTTVYAGVWTGMHSAHHDVGYRWFSMLPGFEMWRAHHLAHHRQPNRNFGTVFIWTDWLFGTKHR